MKNPLILTVIGGLISLVLLALILSRTEDLGIVGIALSIGMAMLWFYLSTLISTTEPDIGAETSSVITNKQKIRFNVAVSIALMAIIFLLLTGILSILFDAYNNQLAKLISLGELSISTSRASAALQLTFGGMLAISFWLPQIFAASYWVGRRSDSLTFYNCASAVVLGVGLFVVANFVAEAIGDDLSMDRVLNSIFVANEEGVPRLAAETWFIRLSAVAFGMVFLVGLSFGVWQAAKVGYKHSVF